ncbi:MAG: hypothetical protein L0229_25390 [Blastocatellia bacterium]|nr:hypothetical protein [Blastocatellia bacterium]
MSKPTSAAALVTAGFYRAITLQVLIIIEVELSEFLINLFGMSARIY